jgi:hypothetical protein
MPRASRSRGLAASSALLVLLALSFVQHAVTPPPAQANGGTLRLANVPMGAYLVSVFTDPTPVRPDSLDVSVLIVSGASGEVVEGLDVRVRTRHLEGVRPEEERPATREEADDPRYYAAKFALAAEGEWEIRVSVQGPEGSGEAAFQLRARDRGLLGSPLVLIFLALLPLLVVGAWIARQSGEAHAGTDDGGTGDGRAGDDSGGTGAGGVSPGVPR